MLHLMFFVSFNFHIRLPKRGAHKMFIEVKHVPNLYNFLLIIYTFIITKNYITMLFKTNIHMSYI